MCCCDVDDRVGTTAKVSLYWCLFTLRAIQPPHITLSLTLWKSKFRNIHMQYVDEVVNTSLPFQFLGESFHFSFQTDRIRPHLLLFPTCVYSSFSTILENHVCVFLLCCSVQLWLGCRSTRCLHVSTAWTDLGCIPLFTLDEHWEA